MHLSSNSSCKTTSRNLCNSHHTQFPLGLFRCSPRCPPVAAGPCNEAVGAGWNQLSNMKYPWPHLTHSPTLLPVPASKHLHLVKKNTTKAKATFLEVYRVNDQLKFPAVVIYLKHHALHYI